MGALNSKAKENDAMSEVYFGVDVHEKESQVAVLDKEGTALLEKRFPTGKLSEFISKFPAEEKYVAIESVGFIRPIYEGLTRIPSCSVSVANPSKVKLIAGSKTKNDRSDSFILGDLLRTNYLPESYIADDSTMEKRYLIRDRVNYGLRRAQLNTSIRWMLKRRGIKIKAPFSENGRKELRKLGLREINIRLKDLELTESIIKELDTDIALAVMSDKNAQLIDTIPGIAPYTALFLSSELGDVSRFPDSKHAAAYVGLVPSLHQSGDESCTGHITRSGNKWLRRNLIECARIAIIKDEHLKEYYLKIKRKKGDRKAIIAVARKLLVYAYWMLKRNETYEELSPWVNSWGKSPSPE